MSDAPAPVGPDLVSGPFAKAGPDLASAPSEDRDGNGLTDRPSVRWLLWCSEAGTIFGRGVLSGLFPGVGGGGIAITFTDSTNLQTLATNGALGFAAGLLIKGLERFHLWQAKPEGEMPNPFRAQP